MAIELEVSGPVAGSAADIFAAAAVQLSKALSGPARATAIKVLGALQGYSGVLEETNDRVSTVKTFANPELPVGLLDHFVTTQLRAGERRKPIDQDKLIEKLIKPSRIVVSATAGYGKSMLMKYIALSLYQNPRGKIPIFVELRNLNRVTTQNLLAFINSTYRKDSTVGIESFRQGLSYGAFVLILDGFDEINHDLRSQIETQILDLSREYPKSSIIVSGRPDDKFLSWRSFEVFKICPMQKGQVIELLNKLEYDAGTKRRFIQKIRSGLYQSHESFLSTPLLAILMLLTFKENANIPDKMHLFYSKAFETLFHKHDAMKEQYDRKRRSSLQIDDFEKIFSVFCLSTYVGERIEFTRVELTKAVKKAIEFTGISVPPEDFIFDVEEAVCLLQKEGNSFFFIHRSFQEYFTAVFLSNCPEETRDEFIDKVAIRYWDNVLTMLFDMAASQIEPTWVLKGIQKYIDYVAENGGDDFAILTARWKGISFYKNGNTHELFNLSLGDFNRFLTVMHRFYPEAMSIEATFEFSTARKLLDLRSVDEVDLDLKRAGSFKIRNYIFNKQDSPVLVEAGFYSYAREEYVKILEVRDGIDAQQASRNEFLRNLFGNDA